MYFMHFPLALRTTSSSNNEKGRRELLEHQGVANPALHLKKKPLLCALFSEVETAINPTPFLSSGFCHLNIDAIIHTQFLCGQKIKLA